MVSVLAASNQWRTTVFKVLHSSLSQSTVQRKCISAVLWQYLIKHASNIHPNLHPKYLHQPPPNPLNVNAVSVEPDVLH